MLLQYLTFGITVIAVLGSSLPDQCLKGNHYEVKDEWTRASAYSTTAMDRTHCDAALREGWFRFTLTGRNASVDIPDRQNPPKDNFDCNTYYPMYLDGIDPYPQQLGDTVQVPLCIFFNKTETCLSSTKTANYVNITNCGSFNVYFLTKPPQSCPIAYCAGFTIIHPITTPAPTTTPGSSAMPTLPPSTAITPKPTALPVDPPASDPIIIFRDEELILIITDPNANIRAIYGRWIVRTYTDNTEKLLTATIKIDVSNTVGSVEHRFKLPAVFSYDSVFGQIVLTASIDGQNYGDWMKPSFRRGSKPDAKGSHKHRKDHDNKHKHKHHHSAVIAGIAVGGVLLIALIIGAASLIIRKRTPMKAVGPTHSNAPPAYESLDKKPLA